MSAAYRASAAGGVGLGLGTSVTATITAAVGDLFVVFIADQGDVGNNPTCTDDNGGTYTRIVEATYATGADSLNVFVRNSLLANTSSTIVTVTKTNSTPAEMCVVAVSGMSRSGTGAVLQYGLENDGAATGTPSPSFSVPATGVASLASNMLMGAFAVGVNPPAMTPPSGWTEQLDAGQTNVFSAGLEVVTVDSGVSATSVTWGSASPGLGTFASFILELNGAPPPAYQYAPSPIKGLRSAGPRRHFVPSPKNSAFLVSAQPFVKVGFRDFATRVGDLDDAPPMTVGPLRNFRSAILQPKRVSAQTFVAQGAIVVGAPVGKGNFTRGPFTRRPFAWAYLVNAAAPSGDIAGTASIVFGQSADVSAQADVSATASITFGQSAAISASIDGAGSSAITFGQSGAIAAQADITGTSPIVFGQSADLSIVHVDIGRAFPGARNARPWARGPFSLPARGPASYLTITATPSGDIAGTASITFGQSGVISAQFDASGTAAITFGQTGTIAARQDASGTASLIFGQTGTISATADLSASAAITFGQSADLSIVHVDIGRAFPGARNARPWARGPFSLPAFSPFAYFVASAPGAISGTASITFGQSGAIAAQADVSGTAAVTFGQSGSIAVIVPISGSASITFGQLASIFASVALAGSSAITFGQSGAASATASIAGTAGIVFGQSGAIVGTVTVTAMGRGFFGVRHSRPWSAGPFNARARRPIGFAPPTSAAPIYAVHMCVVTVDMIDAIGVTVANPPIDVTSSASAESASTGTANPPLATASVDPVASLAVSVTDGQGDC